MKFTGYLFVMVAVVCNIQSLTAAEKLKIEEATVFLKGAQLTSTASISLAKGENEVVFSHVARDVNGQSLSVSVSNGVIVESATFKNDYLLNEVVAPKAKAIKDSIDLITEQRDLVANKIDMLTEQITIIQANRKVGGENTGLSTAELQKLLDIISTKMESILNQKDKQVLALKKIDELLVRLNKQLDEEHKREFQPGGQIVVKFYATDATKTNVTITYIVPNAGWEPCYDIKVDDITQPVKLYYKANVYQNSGVRWDNVRLSLSAGNPSEGVQAPVLNPWYLAFYVPKPMQQKYASSAMSSGNAVRAYKKPLVGSLDNSMAATTVADESSINDYVSVDNSGVNTSFDIDLPYTIPADGKKHLVAIKKYDVPATYRYFAVPKLDKDAFLQAQITNWEDLNLMPGQTSIFYEGTYTGQGYLDTWNMKDTLSVSLGRDKKIIIKKERDKKLRSVKYIGTNVRETFAYTITVRNTRKERINLIIQDQQPVSNDKDIEIEEQDAGGSEFDAATGLMTWALSINASETQNVKFGLTLKYPRGKAVDNLPK